MEKHSYCSDDHDGCEEHEEIPRMVEVECDCKNDSFEEVYIGCKIVRAELMLKSKFNALKKEIPLEQIEPYLVDDEYGYMVTYEDGYKSWSPRGVFERCYRLVTLKEKNLINI